MWSRSNFEWPTHHQGIRGPKRPWTTNVKSGVFDQNDQYVKRRWKQAQYIADLFWKRWSKEYLATLQERQKWNTTQLTEGDIVLIADATALRNSWQIGKVIKTFPDKADRVRSVRIKTKTDFVDRPITKLCLLVESEIWNCCVGKWT